MVSLSFDPLHASRTPAARRVGKVRRYNWRLIVALAANTVVWVAGIWMAIAQIH